MKEIKELYKAVIGTLRKHGYRIDDEARSAAGLAIAVAIRDWRPGEGASLQTFCTLLTIREIIASLPKEEQAPENFAFIDRHPRRDRAQALLMQYPEPERSIGFAVWIERKEIQEVCLAFAITPWRLHVLLDEMSFRLRNELEDIP